MVSRHLVKQNPWDLFFLKTEVAVTLITGYKLEIRYTLLIAISRTSTLAKLEKSNKSKKVSIQNRLQELVFLTGE